MIIVLKCLKQQLANTEEQKLDANNTDLNNNGIPAPQQKPPVDNNNNINEDTVAIIDVVSDDDVVEIPIDTVERVVVKNKENNLDVHLNDNESLAHFISAGIFIQS